MMLAVVRKYEEPMRQREVSILKTLVHAERKACYSIYYRLMIGCFVLPFFGAWYSALAGAPHAFSVVVYFSVAGLLLAACALVMLLAYFMTCRTLLTDIKKGAKTIAVLHILQKKYIVNNDGYFFMIGSDIRRFIEVTQYDYQTRKEGDEISIEYATHSREYLGYF